MVTRARRRPWVLAVAVLTVVGIDLAHGLRAKEERYLAAYNAAKVAAARSGPG